MGNNTKWFLIGNNKERELHAKYMCYLDSKKTKDGNQTVLVRISCGLFELLKNKKKKYIPIVVSAQWRVPKDFFDRCTSEANVRESKRGSNLIERIMDVVDAAEVVLGRYGNMAKLPLYKDLKYEIENELGRIKHLGTDKLFSQYIQDLLDSNANATQLEKLSEGQVINWNKLKNQLLEYEAVKALTVETITNDDTLEFYDYLNEQHKKAQKEKGEKPYGYSQNYIYAINKLLKTVLRKAKLEHKVVFDFDHPKTKFKMVEAHDQEVVLNQEQIQRLLDMETVGRKAFEHAKNYIKISACSTGLRISDMKEISTQKPPIELNDKGYYGFYIRTTKGNKTTYIPVLKEFYSVLKANNFQIPDFPSETKINDYLKEFAEFAGLDEPVELKETYYKPHTSVKYKEPLYKKINSHLCRESFITNLLEMDLTREEIAKVTHSKEREKLDMPKSYDKRSAKQNTDQFVVKLEAQKNKSKIYRIARPTGKEKLLF